MSGKCLGAAAHEVNTLPPRINAQDMTCLSKEWAAAASKISSRNQSVYVILDGFATPSTVLWSRSAGNKVRRHLHGKTCVASRWFEKRMTTKLKKVVLKKDEQLKGNAWQICFEARSVHVLCKTFASAGELEALFLC